MVALPARVRDYINRLRQEIADLRSEKSRVEHHAAWIFEKFRTWSDCAGELEHIFTRDELLTDVMIYWVTETLNSSARLYYESREQPLQLSPTNRVKPPVAVAVFPKEIPVPPRALVERGYNIVRWTAMPRGGHFAAMEQ